MTHTNTASLELASLKPDIYTALVPSDAAQQKRAFLAGTIRNPHHEYAKLDRPYADEVGEIINVGIDAVQELGDARQKFEGVYDECIESFVETDELMDFMRRYDETDDLDERQQYRDEIMKLNIETYGQPDVREYHHILATYMSKIDTNHVSFRGASLRAYYELMEGFPTIHRVEDPGAYAPRPETVEWMHTAVEHLYGGMLAHVEEGRVYAPYELQALFLRVIADEFGEEVAAEWRVDVEPATSINVKAQEKRIVIPSNREPVNAEKARDLIVHELGVHMLRAVSGFDTNVPLLGTGLAKYLDSEEGLGVVMEQARKGKFNEAGHGLYLAASLAYIEGLDFRGVFEIVWRVALLSSTHANEVDAAEGARNTAYNLCMRIFRGTDSLPWFKDLQYYNGASNVWKHLDKICGDDAALSIILAAKTDIANQTQRNLVLEAASL